MSRDWDLESTAVKSVTIPRTIPPRGGEFIGPVKIDHYHYDVYFIYYHGVIDAALAPLSGESEPAYGHYASRRNYEYKHGGPTFAKACDYARELVLDALTTWATQKQDGDLRRIIFDMLAKTGWSAGEDVGHGAN